MKDEEMAEEYADRTETKDWEGFDITREVRKQAFLAGLKAGRPQWHDLQKDPNDLPDEGTYLVVWQNARGYRDTMIMNYEEDDEEKLHWIDGEQDCWDDDVTAWCEIPTFEKESENYTVEQNAGENQIEGGVVSISGSVSMYRPFNNCDELVECWEKKMLIPAVMFTKDERDKLYRPSIWVKSKIDGTDNLITAFCKDNESIGGSCVFFQDIWVDMKELFDNFTFLDGSPCGVEE